MPGHGAVLQRHDLVAHAGVDQRLRADDAARAAAAVDDDSGIGRRRKVREAVDQLRPRHADRRGNAIVVVLLVGAAVVDRDIGLAIDQGLQVLGGYPGCAGLMLHHLGECLAGHVHAAVDAKARRFPRGNSTVEPADVLIAECRHPRGGARRQPLAIVAPDDARTAPRHQIVGQQLQSAQRSTGRHQQMAPAEWQLLARIEQGQLAAIVQLGFQCPRIDAFDLIGRHAALLAVR